MKFVSKEAQNSTIVACENSRPSQATNIAAAILNSTQQPGRVFVTSHRPRDFAQIACDRPFNYHSGLWLLLNHIILIQTCSKLRNNNTEDAVKDAGLVAGFSRPHQFWVGRSDVTGCHDSFKMTVSEVSSFEINFFRKVRVFQRTETSVSGKAECLLAIAEDKKSKHLEWPSPLNV